MTLQERYALLEGVHAFRAAGAILVWVAVTAGAMTKGRAPALDLSRRYFDLFTLPNFLDYIAAEAAVTHALMQSIGIGSRQPAVARWRPA